MKYRITNWGNFQHYKDRNPLWIKLHISILTSEDWVTLNDSGRVLSIACMLVASKTNGIIDTSPAGVAYIKRVAYLYGTPNFKPLIESGFLSPVSDASICERMQAEFRPETETETETDQRQIIHARKSVGVDLFDRWYSEYPRKVARPAALKAWNKHNFDSESVDDLIAVLKKQKRRWTDPQFIPYPATYLNQCRWQDPPQKILGDTYNSEKPDEPMPF